MIDTSQGVSATGVRTRNRVSTKMWTNSTNSGWSVSNMLNKARNARYCSQAPTTKLTLVFFVIKSKGRTNEQQRILS